MQALSYVGSIKGTFTLPHSESTPIGQQRVIAAPETITPLLGQAEYRTRYSTVAVDPVRYLSYVRFILFKLIRALGCFSCYSLGIGLQHLVH